MFMTKKRDQNSGKSKPQRKHKTMIELLEEGASLDQFCDSDLPLPSPERIAKIKEARVKKGLK